MKYIILSDIHGNVDALLAVIKEIAERENPIDNLLIAGDIVGYGASPNVFFKQKTAYEIVM